MKAKTKFLKMFYKLPEKARTELVYNFAVHPMTLSVCALEVKYSKSELGKQILKDLGYFDD